MLYAYKEIMKEQENVQKYFRNLPISGKRTSWQTVKKVRKIVSDMTYSIAQRCNIIVAYPRLNIQGTVVVLGEPTIMLPDCSIVNFEELKKIELNHRK